MSYNTVSAIDHVNAEGDGGLSLLELERFLADIDYQPRWLVEAQRCADYYDGKQLDGDVFAALQARGQPPLVFNLVAPAIDGVLGMEAKTRTDWIVRADNDDGLEVAEGLNEKLNEACRVAEASRACSDAYAAQVKTGLGWVEVNRNSDPFAYRYRCSYVHRAEIHWDWTAKSPDLSDARYLVRSRWADEDQAIIAFPKFEQLIRSAINGWGEWFRVMDDVPDDLFNAYNVELSSDRVMEDYYDYGRQRIRIYEMWYRRWKQGVVMKLASGRVLEFDPKNPMHRAAVELGHVEVSKGLFPVMRLAFFLGPHRVMDIPSPLPHGNFPYIPFWGFREDLTHIPYGLIRRMLSPQDEVNARRSKMMWLLTARRVIMDSDATDMTAEEVLDETARGDGLVLLNPTRQNRDDKAFRVEQDFQLAAQQFQVMKDAEEAIQNVSGIYSAMLGKDAAAQSGVAISSLVEQSSTTLAELNDNYRYARRLVGQHVLDMIVQDIGRKEEEVILNVNRPQKTKRVKLNEHRPDGTINNDVARTKAKVVLDDITATAGYRAQIANRIMDLLETLPEDLRAPLIPIALEATDIPQRDKMIQVLNRVLGTEIDVEKMSDEERAAFEAEQQEKARERELAMAEMEEKIEEIRARVAKYRADVDSKQYDNRHKEAQTEKLLAEIQQLKEQVGSMRQDMVDRIDAENAALEARNVLSQMDIAQAVAGQPEMPHQDGAGMEAATPPHDQQ